MIDSALRSLSTSGRKYFLVLRFTKWPCEEGRYLGYFRVMGEALREDWLQIHRAMGLSSLGGYLKTPGKREPLS